MQLFFENKVIVIVMPPLISLYTQYREVKVNVKQKTLDIVFCNIKHTIHCGFVLGECLR